MFVIQAEQAQRRRVQVVNLDAILAQLVAVFTRSPPPA
jgi:hypothetical protein